MATGRVSGGRRSGGIAGGTRMSSGGTKGAKKAVNKINKELKRRGIDDSIAYVNPKGKVVGSNQGDYTVLKGSNRKIVVAARNAPVTPVKKTAKKKSK
jgi:hypothetical protein